MATRIRIQKDLEQSFQQGSVVVTDSNNEAGYLAPGAVGDVLTINGSSLPAWVAPAPDWHLTGNVASSTDFLGTTNAQDLVLKRNTIEGVRLAAGGSLLATGSTVLGVTPTSGGGTRMMWIPAKRAFRAGQVGSTQWDDANIGIYSFAVGVDNMASGGASVVMGGSNSASGSYNFAMGNQLTISGTTSIGIGTGSIVSGSNSMSLGSNISINANYSTGIGSTHLIDGAYSVAIGKQTDTAGQAGGLLLGDNSATLSTYLVADTNNQFKARYAGGYKFNTSNSNTVASFSPGGTINFSGLAGSGNRAVYVTPTGDLTTFSQPTAYRLTAFVAYAGAVENSLLPLSSGSGTLTFTGAQLNQGILRTTIRGTYKNDVGSPDITLRIKLNAFVYTMLITPTATPNGRFVMTFDLRAGATNSFLFGETIFSVLPNGTTYAMATTNETVPFLSNIGAIANNSTTYTLNVTVEPTDTNTIIQLGSATVEYLQA